MPTPQRIIAKSNENIIVIYGCKKEFNDSAPGQNVTSRG